MSAGAGTDPTWNYKLSFAIEHQEATYWCWAATAVSTARFLLGDTRSQCDLADAVLGRTDCCGTGKAGPCDVAWSLRSALQVVKTFVRMEPRPLSAAELTAELMQSRPIAARVEWPDGGGHVMVIAGIATDDRLEIADPWYGSAAEPYARYVRDYLQLGGRWTHSYLLVDHDPGAGTTDPLKKVASLLLDRGLQAPFPVSLRGASVSAVDVSVYSARVDDLAATGLSPQLTGRESLPADDNDVVRGYTDRSDVPSLRVPSYAQSLRRTLSGLLHSGRSMRDVRLLKVPSLYVTALWIHSGGRDVFLPLEPAPRYLRAGQEYQLRQFERLLREHAISRMRDMAREREMTYGPDSNGSGNDSDSRT